MKSFPPIAAATFGCQAIGIGAATIMCGWLAIGSASGAAMFISPIDGSSAATAGISIADAGTETATASLIAVIGILTTHTDRNSTGIAVIATRNTLTGGKPG